MKTGALAVPCLPADSPMAATPPGMRLPLLPHQQRALHRCLLIEQDGSLSKGFNALPSGYAEYVSRGGVLADAVGMGKTATAIALVLQSEGEGATLVVTPSHLIPQWKAEVQKFAPDIEVLVGKDEAHAARRLSRGKRRIVLVDIEDILNADKLWYDFRRVFDEKGGRQTYCSRERMEEYKASAKCCVQSPRGPCSYDGWVYIDTLHIPKVPWRRVIFDEIQDLFQVGTDAQKNLLQLTRKARNVWLLTATPFPHGNASVEANHELLGFCRLRLDVEVNGSLHDRHPFEIIKRKLYVSSPKHVADEAVTASKLLVRTTEHVERLPLEIQFYQLELQGALEKGETIGFGSRTLREMTIHPEACQSVRDQVHGNNTNAPGRYSTVSIFARIMLNRAKDRLSQLPKELQHQRKLLHLTERSLLLGERIKAHREQPRASTPWASATSDKSDTKEIDVVHDFFCSCRTGEKEHCLKADKVATLRITPEPPSENEFIRSGKGATSRVIQHFAVTCHPNRTVQNGEGRVSALDHFLSVTRRTITNRTRIVQDLEDEKKTLKTRVSLLSSAAVSPVDNSLSCAHGSKPAALVKFLQAAVSKGEKVLVFSMWHETLHRIKRTLLKCKLPCTFCEGSGDAMRNALMSFTTGKVNILLLSALAKASGANLQCASHVVLLDPAGKTAEHGAALEQQAIGRAVRIGQDKPVTVTRFCVKDTLEKDLFDQIDQAAAKSAQRANDASYVCFGAHKTLPQASNPTVPKETDVTVVESVSPAEMLNRRWEDAKKNGAVISIDSDDDEETEDQKGNLSPQICTTANPTTKDSDLSNRCRKISPGLSIVNESAASAVEEPEDQEGNIITQIRSTAKPTTEGNDLKRRKISPGLSIVNENVVTVVESASPAQVNDTVRPATNQEKSWKYSEDPVVEAAVVKALAARKAETARATPVTCGSDVTVVATPSTAQNKRKASLEETIVADIASESPLCAEQVTAPHSVTPEPPAKDAPESPMLNRTMDV